MATAAASLRLCRRLPRNASPSKLFARTLVSATPRSTSPSARIPRSPALHHSHSSTTVPDLCLGAGGKAPGFVQQMLFSAPVQDRHAKGTEPFEISLLILRRANKSEHTSVSGRKYFAKRECSKCRE